MFCVYLSSLLFFAHSAISLSIIFPLYKYPGEKGAAWSDVFAAIEAQPDAQWEMIINPNSGPGAPSVPDANLLEAITKVKSYANVRTVGYVLTGHGSRDMALVKSDVDVYAKWADADIGLGGIYFDEVSSEEKEFSYYQELAEYARSSMSSSARRVVFNPGYRAPTELFSYCDTMVEFEDSLANYQAQGIIEQIPSAFRKQSALQIYSTPVGADVASEMSKMKQAGIEAVYFGSDCCYKEYDAGLLNAMAEGAAGAAAASGAVSQEKTKCKRRAKARLRRRTLGPS